MKGTLFLYNFAKVFIPGAIILCIIFGVSHNPKVNLKITNLLQAILQPEHLNLPKQAPSRRQERVMKSEVSEPEKPRSYIYIVEFKSGGTMKAKGVLIMNNIVTLIVDDGYSVKIAKSDIKEINKLRL